MPSASRPCFNFGRASQLRETHVSRASVRPAAEVPMVPQRRKDDHAVGQSATGPSTKLMASNRQTDFAIAAFSADVATATVAKSAGCEGWIGNRLRNPCNLVESVDESLRASPCCI